MNVKIKTFRFKGSDTEVVGSGWDQKVINGKDDESIIDATINQFLKENVEELIEIKIDLIYCQTRQIMYNKIDLLYTIIYR